jgi:catechol 2,3-dioxygenase-like lactoylglutathione lyase family enzyme
MIHHASLGTNDLDRARAFYDPVLATLGIRLMKIDDKELLYGTSVYLLNVIRPMNGRPATVGNGSHLAFAAYDRRMVQEFHRVAMKHGGTDDGPPGIRPEYDDNYFGAFVRDPDGNKIEAVTCIAK